MRFQTPLARLAIACGLGLAVTSGLYVVMSGNQAMQAPAEASVKVPVVTVKRQIPALTKITTDDVVVKHVPADVAPSGAPAQPGQVVGRFVRQEIFPGETLIEAKLYPADQQYPTVLPLPVGKRAVTVAVNEVVGVAGFIQAGSHVDVVATLDVEHKTVSRIILQGIQVLAAAQNPQRDEDPKAQVVSSVTLAVTPEEAEQLTLATEKGTIRLAMRSPFENGQVKTDGETPGSLVGLKAPAPAVVAAKPAPAKTRTVVKVVDRPVAPPAPADPGIMVIRGTSTSFVQR